MKNLNKLSYTLCVVLLSFLFTGCANVSPHTVNCITSNSYGFLGGLWHGLIIPFSWVGSLFSDNIAIYAYDNSGGWYNFGFVLGLSTITGSSVSSKRGS